MRKTIAPLLFFLANFSAQGADSPVAGPRAEITAKLRQGLPARIFMIPKAQAEALQKEFSLSADELLIELMPLAKDHAVAPISKYHVGEAARATSGNVYLSVNVEFPGHPLFETIHAEQFMVASLGLAGEKGLETIATPAAPCGHCRQFMWELDKARDVRLIFPGKPPFRLTELLPFAFGPDDLGVKGALLAQPDAKVKLAPDVRLIGKIAKQADAALAAAKRSYGPYTGPSGVVLITKDGKTFPGSTLDNAAFNPSLPAFQVAIVGMIVAGADPAGLASVILVEKAKAPMSQESNTRALLATIAPSAKFYRFTLKDE